MSFRKRNKIRIPTEETDNDEIDEIRPHNNIKIAYNREASDSESDDDDLDNLPGIKFKKRSGKVTFLKDHVTDNVIKPSTILSYDNTSKSDSGEIDDGYKELYSNKPTKTQVLNLEDEEELDEMEQKDSSSVGVSDKYSQAEIDKIKLQRESLRNKQQKSSEVEKGTPTEKDYAKLLTTEERLDLMDTIKDNGGVQKANEHKDFTNIEDYVDERLEDERLALTENERTKQEEARRNMIQKALDEDDSNDAATREWQYNLTQHGTNVQQDSSTKKNVQLPILWPAHDTDKDDSFIEDELKKLSVQHKTVQMKLDAMQKERLELKQRRQQILNELATIGI